MKQEKIPRLDELGAFRKEVLKHCRLKHGEIWTDHQQGHRVAVIDAADGGSVARLAEDAKPSLFIHDPPYNIAVGNLGTEALSVRNISEYLDWCGKWISSSVGVARADSYFYIWIGADQSRDFQPLPDFMIMMRDFEALKPRSFITMRNQRGYGTQKNWMFVRQELLCYTKGNPVFTVTYTDIPKILRGYYKKIGGEVTENLERGKSDTIRPGNVWVDVQQVFYRMEENVPGAYAQKPLKAVQRIISTSSDTGDTVADFFSHSGTTLIASEMSDRTCITCDIDPVFAELTIRRLEHYRETGKTGWQTGNPFPEVSC